MIIQCPKRNCRHAVETNDEVIDGSPLSKTPIIDGTQGSFRSKTGSI